MSNFDLATIQWGINLQHYGTNITNAHHIPEGVHVDGQAWKLFESPMFETPMVHRDHILIGAQSPFTPRLKQVLKWFN